MSRDEAGPTCYLSRYPSPHFIGGIAWSVIVSGLPICADQPSRAQAEKAAAQYRVKPSAIWDGTGGNFWPLDTFTDAEPQS